MWPALASYMTATPQTASPSANCTSLEISAQTPAAITDPSVLLVKNQCIFLEGPAGMMLWFLQANSHGWCCCHSVMTQFASPSRCGLQVRTTSILMWAPEIFGISLQVPVFGSKISPSLFPLSPDLVPLIMKVLPSGKYVWPWYPRPLAICIDHPSGLIHF